MNPNTGSFGAPLGDVSALKAAMQRRGIDASILDQISGGTPMGPSPVPPSPEPTNTGGQPPQAGVTEATPSQPDSDVTIAMKALATVVTNDSKTKRDLVTLRSQGVV